MWLTLVSCANTNPPEPTPEASPTPPTATEAAAPVPPPPEPVEEPPAGPRLESVEPSLLVNGSFEEGDLPPSGWQTMVAATSGTSETRSTIAWTEPLHGERALRLEGDSNTHRWSGLASDVIPVTGGALYSVEGHMKVDQVAQEGDQAHNCNLGLQFVDGDGAVVNVGSNPVVGTPPMSGTESWTPVRAVVRAPDGASGVRVLALHSMTGTAWFDALRFEAIEEPVWQSSERKDFVFHWTEGDAFAEEDMVRNGQILYRLRKELSTFPKGRIEYRLYANRAQKELLTGDPTDSHVADGAMHTLQSIDAYGQVLWLTQTWGGVHPWFSQALAIAQAGWGGKPLSSWERKNEPPAIRSLLTDDLAEEELPAAASLANHLIALEGIDVFRSAATGEGTIEERLGTAYGKSLDELQVSWSASRSP